MPVSAVIARETAESHQVPEVDVSGFLREWARHENAPRTACPECHFEQSDCCDRHRNNHAPGCSQGGAVALRPAPVGAYTSCIRHARAWPALPVAARQSSAKGVRPSCLTALPRPLPASAIRKSLTMAASTTTRTARCSRGVRMRLSPTPVSCRAAAPAHLAKRCRRRTKVPENAARHWHLITRHRHPFWHGHCDQSKRGYKRCSRWHWHFVWRHEHE